MVLSESLSTIQDEFGRGLFCGGFPPLGIPDYEEEMAEGALAVGLFLILEWLFLAVGSFAKIADLNHVSLLGL